MTSPPSRRRDPYAVVRPRAGRVVALATGALVIVVFGLTALLLPGADEQHGGWALTDRLMMFFLGLGIAAFLYRFASIRAIPSKDGLIVRNLILTRNLSWDDIVRIQFGGGAPWATLDLSDTETLAVMAVQKADGEHGRAESRRLAALIEYHSGREPSR